MVAGAIMVPRNEGHVKVIGMECRALIDSGSQITSITHSYWQNHPVLKQRELQPSKIPIEGAGGQAVPYHGVLQVDLKVLGQEYKAVPTFVIPDVDYRSSDQKAGTVARILWNNFFCWFGFPAKLHADQGQNFESAMVKELCKCTGIAKTHTTPYHPQGNGTTEEIQPDLNEHAGATGTTLEVRLA
ncbi:Retrovirus-related Pol poly from transposon 412 [Solea senegalensis]|uniref:Retrovirus-related Pol poly from transposon 412 n=1 Tax=Solea senegalensis TaxID=28829 RepID=A0AAV6Q295_SOLSE|nr:Retrovirus-related Pol poly from transposon 412 [Solea senegalensis]